MLEPLLFLFSKLGEKLVEYGLQPMNNIINFNSIVQSLETNWNALSAKASDVEEQITNVELSGKKKRKRFVENWLKQVHKIEGEFRELEKNLEEKRFISRFFEGDRATKLNARIDGLVEQSQHLGDLLGVCETKGEPLLVTKLVGEKFDKDLERIWNFSVIDKVRVIGIYGMGGVGKTTLAKHVNNLLVEKTQDLILWITVSQVFSLHKLQDEIAKVLLLDISDEDNEDKRAAKLNRALSQRKNCVLILDDIWRNINLEMLGDPLRVTGCKLIITTRSLQVCRQMGCQKIIEVKRLPENEAWNLFNKTLGQETALTPQVQETAKLVAKECGGLPLGLITMAGSMRDVSDVHVWNDTLRELKECVCQDEEMEEVFRVLKCSFDRLGPNEGSVIKMNGYTDIQLCFLYCSLYPEDWEINKIDLLNHFIWEKLMDRGMSRKSEFDRGYAILDKLVNVCLLEIVDGSTCVKMHDLVRDVALKITRNSPKFMARSRLSLVEIPNEEECPEDLNKISLMDNCISKIPRGMSPNFPNLSTLLLNDNPLVFIPDSFFSMMCGLHVLNLARTKIKVLPNSLSDLESLNALILTDCRMLKTVPNLGKLKALRELDLSVTSIDEVPLGMENLVNLKYLSMAWTKIKELPTRLLPRFSHLQCLFLFNDYIKVVVEEIDSLKHLEKFSGLLKDVSEFNSLISFGRSHGCPISCEIKLVGKSTRIMYQYINRSYGVSKHLRIVQCEDLSSCFLDSFPCFNNPKCLKTLKLERCEGISFILSLFMENQQMREEELEFRCVPFRSIEEIRFRSLPDLMGLIDWGQYPLSSPLLVPISVFSSLKRLEIESCENIKNLWLPLSDFQNIEVIRIWLCENLEEIIYGANEEETGGGVVSLPKLKKLYLSNLPKLHSIFKATMECNHIESITIYKCLSLNKFPLFLPSVDRQTLSLPPSLKVIYLGKDGREWWDSLEWENPNYKQILQPLIVWNW